MTLQGAISMSLSILAIAMSVVIFKWAADLEEETRISSASIADLYHKFHKLEDEIDEMDE